MVAAPPRSARHAGGQSGQGAPGDGRGPRGRGPADQAAAARNASWRRASRSTSTPAFTSWAAWRSARGSPVSDPIAASNPVSSCARTGSASRRRSIATGPWPSWPAGTSERSRRPPTGTSPTGPGFRFATCGRGWRRSRGRSRRSGWTGETMLAPRGGLPRLPATGQVRMLGNFDTYLLGWKDRGFSVASEHAIHVKEGGGGWIRPVILEDGIVVGGWRSAQKGRQAGDHPQPAEGGARAARLEDRRRGRGHLALRGD